MIITLKAAISLDGKLALPDGRSHWISGETSPQHAHNPPPNAPAQGAIAPAPGTLPQVDGMRGAANARHGR